MVCRVPGTGRQALHVRVREEERSDASSGLRRQESRLEKWPEIRDKVCSGRVAKFPPWPRPGFPARPSGNAC